AARHGEHDKEALPWWFFALVGGVVSVWLGASIGARLGWLVVERAADEAGPVSLFTTLREYGIDLLLFIPGALAGGVVGKIIIKPVNIFLGGVFKAFNWWFDRTTNAYGRLVGWGLRLSFIVLVVYVGLIFLTGVGFTRIPA